MQINGGTSHSPWGMSAARAAMSPATPFLAAAAPKVTEWRAEKSSINGLMLAHRLNLPRRQQSIPRARPFPKIREGA